MQKRRDLERPSPNHGKATESRASTIVRGCIGPLLGPAQGPILRGGPMHGMLESSDKTFSEDLRRAGRRAVLVFWAPWARQCKDVSVYCRAAGEVAGEEAVIALNTDTNPVTAHAYHVQRVPTVKIITDGAVAWSTEGLPEPEDLKAAWQTASAAEPAR